MLQQYMVHFVEPEYNAFLVWAENIGHAIEQASNAYPEATVYSVFRLILVYIATPE